MDKHALPPDFVFAHRLVNGKKPPAYKPVGVKYPHSAAAIESIGKPTRHWSYSVPWSNQDTWILRYERPDGSLKKFRVITLYKGGWYVCWPPTPYMIYRKHQLLEAETVYVCEGERKACWAASLGLASTTSMGGPYAAKLSDWSPLEEKQVVILRDCDDAGLQYAEDVAQLAVEAGALSVKIVLLPGLANGEGLCEWIQRQPDPRDQARVVAELDALVAVTEKFERKTSAVVSAAAPAGDPVSAPRSQRLSDVAPEPQEWVWGRVIPKAAVTLMTGESGIGKSYLAWDMIAGVTRGDAGPNEPAQGVPAGVLLLSSDDALSITLRPRLDASGANTSLVYVLNPRESASASDDRANPTEDPPLASFNLLEQSLSRLEAELERLDHEAVNIRLVVIDPLRALLGAVCDASVAYGLVTRLSTLATRFGVAIMVVVETGFSGQGTWRPRRTWADSPFLLSVARSVWTIVRDLDNPKRRLLLPVKTNLCEAEAGLAYTICDQVLEWESNPVPFTSDEYLSQAMELAKYRLADEGVSQLTRAEGWLREQLQNGPVESVEIQNKALERQISYGTLRRAFSRLGGLSGKMSGSRCWSWSLPGQVTK